MNENLLILYNLYKKLYEKLERLLFVIDKTGKKLIELMPVNFLFNPNLGHHVKIINPNDGYVFRLTNELYVKLETKWHLSMQLNIKMVDSVKIWQYCSGDNGLINSNYGWCVYNPNNGSDNKSQFTHAKLALISLKDTRRSMLIYTRPTMHSDYKEYNKNDFLCTTWNQFFIRDNKLVMFYIMRSNDCYHGTINNIPWAVYVHNDMYNNLKLTYPLLLKGMIHWFSSSWHLYEYKFKRLKRLFK